MNFKKSQIFEKINSYWQRVTSNKVARAITGKKTRKGVRVTYGVVWNLFLLFFIIAILGLGFAGGAGAGYFASLVKDEPVRSYESLKKDIYNYEENTEVYFANEIYLGQLRADLQREEVSLDEISQYVKDAVIATEDQYFYKHDGVVPKSILRAIVQDVTSSPVQTGGSTLTQQLIKNQILSNEVSFDRKAKEILIALRLEKFFDKDEILEAYLNIIPYGRNSSGRNIAGVQTAAQGIFGVDAKDLNLPQAAFIAGLPQNPYVYTPFSNKGGMVKENLEPGINRMQTVLERMLTAGFITQQQYEEAITYDIRANLAPPKSEPTEKYPWLTAEVEKRATDILMKKLAEEDGYEEKDLEDNKELRSHYREIADKNLRQNGYKIHTTIDKEIFDTMQEVVKNYQYFGPDQPEDKVIDKETGEKGKVLEPEETGSVLIENRTGKIISFVAGRDFEREQTNHAISTRPNGSTMKPLLAYAPAMELGLVQPGSVIADVKFSYGSYKPQNVGGPYDFDGLMSARHALQISKNIPAIKTYLKAFDQRPITFLEKMGFTSLVEQDYHAPSLAIGGMTYGVSVEENVNAFATFANEGKFIDAYMIEKIVTNDGEVVYEHESKPVDVFSPQTAYLTIDMMRDVINGGTASSLNGYLKFKADWAGKTGTTNFVQDVWFVATNPNVTFGLWMGYDTPKSIPASYKGLSYSRRSTLLWAQQMNAVYDIRPELVQPKENFKMPGGIVSRSYCGISGLLPSDLCREAGLVQSDIYNAKYVPTKVDDSLVKGKYIEVNGKAYRVPTSAPQEFVQEGIMIKKEFLEANDLKDAKAIEQLLPKNSRWKNLVITETAELKDNGSVPSQVQGASISSGILRWAKHEHNDVIGYRIYGASNFSADFKKIGSIPATKDLQFNVGSSVAAYYVTAVDVTGKETPLANSVLVKNGDYKPEPEVEVVTPPAEEGNDKENKSENGNKGNNGNGNGKDNGGN
ncbi:transglycosylase domain-containing protein [Fredinandcohnia sp. QZ13]|uniref:transglycosylase domain-containing protein n=1 Tax=Fredinandcohnia sp. QZ13 TaxID=3073144 RepID=UPI00285337D3|nr:transglycosylase domain-containing protein [Fredinandcohnia sp. QZ13]MDR4889260.1 transglycosylase domain-containing protein [Fredinandcohnia sp. QZ13]